MSAWPTSERRYGCDKDFCPENGLTCSEVIESLRKQLATAEQRIEILEISDMTATAAQWEGAFKAERKRLEKAQAELEAQAKRPFRGAR